MTINELEYKGIKIYPTSYAQNGYIRYISKRLNQLDPYYICSYDSIENTKGLIDEMKHSEEFNKKLLDIVDD